MVCSTSGSPDIDDADNDDENSLDNKKSNDDNVIGEPVWATAGSTG